MTCRADCSCLYPPGPTGLCAWHVRMFSLDGSRLMGCPNGGPVYPDTRELRGAYNRAVRYAKDPEYREKKLAYQRELTRRLKLEAEQRRKVK